MNRKHSVASYLDTISTIKRIVPEMAISTDLICRFPSETEDQHLETLALIKKVAYDFFAISAYSDRPVTYASKHFPDDIRPEIKQARLNDFIAPHNYYSFQSNKRDEGKIVEVLVEGRYPNNEAYVFGRTSQNKQVIIKSDCAIGELIHVKITTVTDTLLISE